MMAGNARTKMASMLVLASAMLAGCTTSGSAISTRPDTTPVPTATIRSPAGLDRVMGRDANALVALFGQPDADVREGTARKLQFTSAACVLDAYLYPRGTAATVVTHIDSRQPDGSPIDRASCIAALTRRDGGK